MEIIDSRRKVKNRAEKFIEELKNEVYILGTNKYGLCVARWLEKRGIKIGGFINDFVEISSFESYKVFKSKQLPKKISVINCITEGKVIIAEESVRRIKPISHIDYFALQLTYPQELHEISFLENTDEIEKHKKDYEKIYSSFSDKLSKDTFEKITNFRFNRDITFLKDFEFLPEEQYFEKFFELSENPVFIDGGGYDGKTTKTFIAKDPNYKFVYFFEPSEEHLLFSKELLKGNRNIKFIARGLWSHSETLSFDNTLGSASRISSRGEIIINTVSMDETVKEKVDFIKLDIEGAEYKALKGGGNLVTKYRPVMAICVYHNQEDFVRIPELVLSYNPDYKLFLRHYTQGVCETVMYFV